ncbi:hypothetical protein ALO75_200287 [Pseudomonas syringae pv. coryli]|uniref:Uncharacterized protein n=1 Tax=Pseudomonas syringae pv. coryli TaxID=317659 RepID=A0A0P9NI64_9PSED|nr:hypothetical protein ALO75_200287 [Pseudomonas syringae pv. coryli]
MYQQPARALWQPQSHQQNQQAQYRTDSETQAPAQLGADPQRIEQDNRANRTKRSAQPECAIDGQVNPPPVAGRGEFLNGRIDGRVLAADAHAGQKTEQHEAPDTERERRGGRCTDIQQQGDEEQLATP